MRDEQKEPHMAAAAHFTCSVGGKQSLQLWLLLSSETLYVLFFIWSGNTACFSNTDAISCWQKRGKNLSAASSCKVHDKTELWVNGAHNS